MAQIEDLQWEGVYTLEEISIAGVLPIKALADAIQSAFEAERSFEEISPLVDLMTDRVRLLYDALDRLFTEARRGD